MTLRVLHLSFSSAGGAGSVAKILSNQQKLVGYDSELLSVIEENLRAAPLSSVVHTLAAGIDESVVKNRNFPAPISLVRDHVSPSLAEKLESADIVHLHGINGALSLEELAKNWPNKKIIWTLHDMNPFTGTCHYSLGCQKFAAGCERCPAVKRAFQGMVTDSLSSKIRNVSALANLAIVAPSTWLAKQASASQVFHGHEIHVIANPADPSYFGAPQDSPPQIAAANYTAVVVAKNLVDPVKNVNAAVGAFLSTVGDSTSAQLLLVGEGGKAFESSRVHLLGPLSAKKLIPVLDSADVLIVSSLAENAPLVIAEAAARGVKSIVANVGGMPEMVELLGQGEVFDSPDQLSNILSRDMIAPHNSRKKARASLEKNASKSFSPQAVAAKYAKVYT